MLEAEKFVKVKGEDYSWGVINLSYNQDHSWIEFDRINTKTGEIVGHFEKPMSAIEGIETKNAKPEKLEPEN